MNAPSLVQIYDGDTEMLPINAVVDQVSDSLRQLREMFECNDDGDVSMECAFENQSNDHESSQPLRLLIIDTNILVGHLNLIEWLGELLLAACKLCNGSGYRCGLLIPRMVRLELDKHKMPHNKQRIVTALLEPLPVNPTRMKQNSIQSPYGSSKLARESFSQVGQSIQVSLFEAADQAIKWMNRLFRNTPSGRSIVKFQTKTEVADPNLLTSSNRSGIKVSPDMHILDCALYFKLQVEPQGGGVILLTNDKALSLEAEIEGISTLRIRPGLSPQSLLHSFNPVIAQQIDLLINQVSFKDMLTAKWYKKTPNVDSKLIKLENSKHQVSSRGHHSRYANDDKSLPKKDDVFSIESSNFTEQTFSTQDNMDELSKAMPIEIDEEMPISDSDLIPIFPSLFYQYMLILSPLPMPKLLHFHHHLEQAVGALLRPRLFDFLFCVFAHNDLALLFQQVALAFDKRRINLQISNPQDPNQWTAVDCLILIDEFWNESTFQLFQEEVNQPLPETTNQSIYESKLKPKKNLNSRWAPTSQITTEAQEQQTFLNRLSRTRKAVQVLIDQLQPCNHMKAPQDNPMSWSLLFWDGLIEDIHKVTYYGKFYETLSDLENSSESRDFILQKVIQNWKTEARSLFN